MRYREFGYGSRNFHSADVRRLKNGRRSDF